MKKTLVFLIISYHSSAQIHSIGSPNAQGSRSIEISPAGITSGRIGNPSENITLGPAALSVNYTGKFNTAIGINALAFNVDGDNNTGVGSGALFNKLHGSDNTAIGAQSNYYGWNNHSNTAVGTRTLFWNNGSMNVGAGKEALYNNSTGNENVGIGLEALYNNWYGNYNTAVGSFALRNSDQEYNTAIGYRAGFLNKGSYNTYVGHNTSSNGEISNATAIGYGAVVNASNKVRIGNSAISIIEGQVPWSNPSDRRLKENILYTNRLGLDFITRLQTVSYNYTADQNKTRHDGFIAQDVEKVMKDLGIPFSGLKKSADGTYSLAYSDFVIPLVNAVQEQQSEIEKLKSDNQALKASIEGIYAELERLKTSNSKTIGK